MIINKNEQRNNNYHNGNYPNSNLNYNSSTDTQDDDNNFLLVLKENTNKKLTNQTYSKNNINISTKDLKNLHKSNTFNTTNPIQNIEEKKIRRDAYGTKINKHSSKHKVTFIDKLKPKNNLVT